MTPHALAGTLISHAAGLTSDAAAAELICAHHWRPATSVDSDHTRITGHRRNPDGDEVPGGLFIHRIFGFLRSETLAVAPTESFPQFHRQR